MRINSYNLNLSSQYGYFYKTSQKSVENEDEIRLTTSVSEREKLALSAFGSVKTSEKNISFSAEGLLYREETQSVETVSKKAKMTDPLVINLSGQIASVDEKNRFNFDIDDDGKKDSISLLNGKNAFLAIDKNDDGSINNGNELFGAKSGNGFKDLAEYDSTKDGVIDENDGIFDKLRVWIKTALDDELISLKDIRVGALILDYVNSPFKLTGENGENAQIQKSGVALFEDGKVGWMSHIDFAARQEDDNNEKTQGDNIHANAPKTKSVNIGGGSQNSNSSEVDSALKRLKEELKEATSKLQKATDEQERKLLEGQRATLNDQIAALERVKAENSIAA